MLAIARVLPRVAPRGRRRFLLDWLPWVAPLLLFEFVKREQSHLRTMLAILIGAGVVALVARRPAKALNVLVVVLPFGTFLLALLFRLGIPATFVRSLGFWKEAVIAGIAAAALPKAWRARHKWDRLDRVVIAYVALGSAYLLLPHLLVGSAPGGKASFYARELGWRGDVLYFGIFLLCRHLGIDRRDAERIFRRFLGVAVVVALVGIYEFFNPHSFDHFVVHTIRVPTYEIRVLHAQVGNPNTVLLYGTSGHRVRVGSILLNNLTVGFYWMLALGIAIELLVRGKGKAWIWMGVPVLASAALLTQSRAAILGAAIAVLFGLRSQIGRSITQRVRLTAMLGLALVVFLPLIVFSGVGHRFVSPGGTTNSGHKNGVSQGITIMFHNPVGRGLATGAGGGQVAQTQGAVSQGSVFIPEDEWLQIGTQLGFLGLGIYVAGLILIIRYLRVPRAGPGDPRQPGEVRLSAEHGGLLPSGVRSGLLGVLAGGLFLQPFVEPVVSWTVFALAGLAVGLADAEGAEIHDDVTATLRGRAVESVTAR